MKRRNTGYRLLPLLAAALLCLLSACGSGGKVPAEGSVPGTETGSVLSLPGDEGSARLAADMEAGRIPEKCNVLYDAMGSRPDVTVTDPEQIRAIYDALARVRLTGGEAMSVTDSYHHVIFCLRDGTAVSYRFLGEAVLEKDGKEYAVSGGGPLWTLVRELQDAQMAEKQP